MTPISPELALAMNVVANPGVYALLLGSGVSRNAGIPTGWDVVLDLVQRLAVASGADTEQYPEGWYQSEYGEPPQYSTLLEKLASTPDERRSLLEGYFQPTPNDQAQGIKAPTAAHRAIANLVKAGWIRVIVTTNFDRLLELSLEEAGVTPVVIATAAQASGAIPLAHSKCMVIKVHGDYLDPRIKNSEEELATYEPPMNDLLDRVFDEYGLIVCGWSGEYDAALRDALDRCKSRRYTTYWCTLSDLSSAAERLAGNRSARVVKISGADPFFTELEGRVTSIQATGERHPMDKRAAVETLKRYLPEDRHRIRLRDLVRDATEELVAHLNIEDFPISTQYTDEEIASRIRRLDPLCEQTIALVANGVCHGMPQQDDVWLRVVRRLAEVEVVNPAANRWGSLFRYPALLAFYDIGVASVWRGRYEFLKAVLLMSTRSDHRGETEAMAQSLYHHEIVHEGAAGVLFPHPGGKKYKTPLSMYLENLLRSHFADLIPSDREYIEAFDRFEYLVSLVLADLPGPPYFSGGCFQWRYLGGKPFVEVVDQEINEAQEGWPPLQAGLFGGSLERLREVKSAVEERVRQSRWW